MFFMAPTQVKTSESESTHVLPQIIEFYAGVFVNERDHISDICPKVKHIMITDNHSVIGGLSYVCDGSNSTVVICQLAVHNSKLGRT